MNELLRERLKQCANNAYPGKNNGECRQAFKDGAEAMLKAVVGMIGEFDEITATLTSRLPDCTNAEHTKQRCFINGAEWKHAEILRRLRDE